MSTSQQEVFGAITNERQYQDYRWSKPEHNHSNTEFLVYIQTYTRKALEDATYTDEAETLQKTQDALRKIAALAVAAMEINGVRRREGW